MRVPPRWAATLAIGLCAAAFNLVPAFSTAAAAGASGTPHPFGVLTCVPRYGIRFCPSGMTAGIDNRIPSFDKVPLDADVALPPTGNGPFPLLVLLHGLGGSKSEFEAKSDDGAVDDVTMADHGYAVLMYTARGFGTSCGTKASRAHTPACAKGWIQLADQRHEIRDTQYLAGLLVDEGLAKPGIAVSGVSYGGGQSLELAMLKNRMRLPNGKLVPYVSPLHHTPMSVAAAFPQWPWDDLDTSLVPNGHLDTTPAKPSSPKDDVTPAGVGKTSWLTLLYGVTKGAFLAPPGKDPTADLTVWNNDVMAGEPYTAREEKALSILQGDKSAVGIPMAPGGPAPTVIQAGWTDTLFPVSEDLHYANDITADHDHTPLLMMFDDNGHGWAQNKSADVATTNADAIAFLDSVMLTHTKPHTGVVAIPTTCPMTAPSGPPVTGKSLAALAPTYLRITGADTQVVTSAGGDPAIAKSLDAAYKSPLCNPMTRGSELGTASYQSPVAATGMTLLGAPVVTADITVKGNYPELVGRLWDVATDGRRQIVALGVYRPSVNQAPRTSSTAKATEHIRFQLNPNDWTFAAGDKVTFELVGSTAPLFRASDGHYSITVKKISVKLPIK